MSGCVCASFRFPFSLLRQTTCRCLLALLTRCRALTRLRAVPHARLPRRQMCALLVFTCVSNQRAGLWGPSVRACEACNGSSQCTAGAGGPHGLGCGYTAFGQFQCVPIPTRSASGVRTRGMLFCLRKRHALRTEGVSWGAAAPSRSSAVPTRRAARTPRRRTWNPTHPHARTAAAAAGAARSRLRACALPLVRSRS
jgi:hypothetical protein